MLTIAPGCCFHLIRQSVDNVSCQQRDCNNNWHWLCLWQTMVTYMSPSPDWTTWNQRGDRKGQKLPLSPDWYLCGQKRPRTNPMWLTNAKMLISVELKLQWICWRQKEEKVQHLSTPQMCKKRKKSYKKIILIVHFVRADSWFQRIHDVMHRSRSTASQILHQVGKQPHVHPLVYPGAAWVFHAHWLIHPKQPVGMFIFVWMWPLWPRGDTLCCWSPTMSSDDFFNLLLGKLWKQWVKETGICLRLYWCCRKPGSKGFLIRSLWILINL